MDCLFLLAGIISTTNPKAKKPCYKIKSLYEAQIWDIKVGNVFKI